MTRAGAHQTVRRRRLRMDFIFGSVGVTGINFAGVLGGLIAACFANASLT